MGNVKVLATGVVLAAALTGCAEMKANGAATRQQESAANEGLTGWMERTGALLDLGGLVGGKCLEVALPGHDLTEAEKGALQGGAAAGATEDWRIVETDDEKAARTTLPRSIASLGAVRLAVGGMDGPGSTLDRVAAVACGEEHSGIDFTFSPENANNVLLVHDA